MVASVALAPLMGSALGSTAGVSALGQAVAPSFLSKLFSGGMGGFLGGFGDAVTGLPASQLFGVQESPTLGLGKLLGGGLLGDFSGVGRSAMLGGAMGGGMAQSPQQLNQQGMQMNQTLEAPQFAFPKSQQAIQSYLPPVMVNNQQMLQPLNTYTDPRTIMGGLLAPRNYNII